MKRKSYDPLADHFARGRIDDAQFRAGREFQKHFALADKRQPDALTDGQDAAWKALARCYRQLGLDGSSIVCDVLVHGMTTRQITESRGKTGQAWEMYYARRLRETLGTLAEVYGFSSVPEVDRTKETITRPLRRGSVAQRPI